MATKDDLVAWLEEALNARGRSGTIVELCREIWLRHEPDLRTSGDLFYTWQYDVRWAAYKLRESGVLKPDAESPGGIWELAAEDGGNPPTQSTNFDVAAHGVELAVCELERRGARVETETTSRGSTYLTVTPPNGGHTKRAYVKTRRTGDWQTDTRRGQPRPPDQDPSEFWLFVDMTSEPPDFLIAPAWWVENDIYENHQEYLARHGGHRAINPKATHHRITTARVDEWRGRWDLLGVG